LYRLELSDHHRPLSSSNHALPVGREIAGAVEMNPAYRTMQEDAFYASQRGYYDEQGPGGYFDDQYAYQIASEPREYRAYYGDENVDPLGNGIYGMS
jgi:hypothetical protein